MLNEAGSKEDFKKHSAVIAYFNKNYIANDIFSREYGKKLPSAFTIRQHSDYDDSYIFSREETARLMANASTFLEDVRSYLRTKGIDTARPEV